MRFYLSTILLLILQIVITIKKASPSRNDFTIKISPSNSVTVGQTVTMTCKNLQPKTSQWLHNDRKVGERTIYYGPNKDRIKIMIKAYTLQLTIKKVTINDSGRWICDDMANKRMAELFVIEPWSFKEPIAKKVYHGLRKNSSTNSIEDGRKMFPYNLSHNVTLSIKCQTECGLPAPKYINFKHQNRTSSGNISNDNKQKILKCPARPKLSMMTNELEIDCYKHNLRGKHKITCESTSAQGSTVSTRDLYIQCPIDNVFSGITQGEIVAIIIAVFLAILNIILIVYLLKHNLKLRRKNYKSPSSSSSQTSNYPHNHSYRSSHNHPYSSQITSSRSGVGGDKISPSEVML